MRHHYTLIRMSKIFFKSWQYKMLTRMWNNKNVICCSWECKMVQSVALKGSWAVSYKANKLSDLICSDGLMGRHESATHVMCVYFFCLAWDHLVSSYGTNQFATTPICFLNIYSNIRLINTSLCALFLAREYINRNLQYSKHNFGWENLL